MEREANTQDGKRVVFELPIEARLMAIDGTWQRVCKIYDVSEMSAKLVIDGVLTDIGQREFFLVLSATGLAYRHCELAWVNGEFVGVQFLNRGRAKRARRGETLVKQGSVGSRN
ncbi:PilZ domain-containing protein [Bradyrhizobium sp. 76]|uniref:PilZ domain-containing protein n=1 Tax=Bradyrhizobium sp. 76 TaxID=2782680 RepID=UPI001FF9E1B4|nr:PilZ domain-containing protein [Bradyrhizobium sp. 76]MCK1405105.1 PilZ domain-containing protein [Bradyrhizobium sp. 76]